ncbi:unnamed protein product [Linum trigynum]|uniref:Uncharacterized protein n=1 Tax=Linum trigynum TaxID=586398 RepID=A0AAV2E7R9_9ROSI
MQPVPSVEVDQQPIRPRLMAEWKPNFTNSKLQFEGQPNNSETSQQVYLTTWLCKVNVDSPGWMKFLP